MNRQQGEQIAAAIATNNGETILDTIDAVLADETGKHWIKYLNKLKRVVHTGLAEFSIFSKDGNSKLPFLAFSALPGATACPGAGECLNFCYSFRAWRYPAAFCRQAQNSILMGTMTGRQTIYNALREFETEESIDFRLYVDGDFRNHEEVSFWMDCLFEYKWLNAYGYSKSWEELLAYENSGREWPTNYQLNLSSGSRHNAEVKAQVKALPIARGEFIAVSIGEKVTSAMHNDREHQMKLREAHGRKAFTCPGKCGSCTNKGHACGSARFKGIDIIIAVH